MYFPPFGSFSFGAIMFLNQICNTKVDALSRDGVRIATVLGDVGHWAVESMIRNHLLRPKAELLTIH